MACKDTGYLGREAVCEVLELDADTAAMVRDGYSVQDIRQFVQGRGYRLITDHTLEKVRQQVIDVAQARQRVLVDEQRYRDVSPTVNAVQQMLDVDGGRG